MADAFVPGGEDAPSMMTPDSPSAMTPDSPSAMTPDSPSAMTPDSPTMMMSATWADVHDQLTMNCAPCHSSGMSGGHRMAQANATMAYTDSQLTAASCVGLSKGACAAMRVRAGTMPPGGLPEPARTNLANLMDAWVAAGQMGP